MNLSLNAESTSLRIKVDASLTAAAVQSLIHELAKLRAAMVPSISLDPAGDQGANALNQSDPHWTVRSLRGGGLRFWFRNAGIGWLTFEIPATKAQSLRDFLARAIASESAGALFGEQGPDGDRLQ